MNHPPLPSGYRLRPGTLGDRPLLTQFVHRSYQDQFPQLRQVDHLSETVEEYFSAQTPLWWIEQVEPPFPAVACLWMGNAIDQGSGDRYGHIFLLYVMPAHRRRGLAKVLLAEAQTWAAARGDRQIGLQVFTTNHPALALYGQLGFQPQSLLMMKSLGPKRE